MSNRIHDIFVAICATLRFVSIDLAFQPNLAPQMLVPVGIMLLLAAAVMRFLVRARCSECGSKMKRRITTDHDDQYVEYYCPGCGHTDHCGPIEGIGDGD